MLIEEIPVWQYFSIMSENPTSPLAAVYVGDSAQQNGEYRGFWRFKLDDLPPGAEIVSATLRTTRRATVGSPEALLGGQILLDDLGWEHENLTGLNAMYAFTLEHEFTELNPGPNNVFNASVTDRLQAAVDDGRTRFNLRAHWIIPSFPNNAADFELFDITDNLPTATLTVMYRP